MQNSSVPSKFSLPFANSGTKNTIPAASQISVKAGAASLTDGFPPLTMTALAAGGVAPSGADMNGILNMLSAVAQWANACGGYVFDESFATAISGYPKGALLLKADFSGFWFNTVEGNTNDPDTVSVATSGWIDPFSSLAASVYYQGTPTSGSVTTFTRTLQFTAPCNGVVMAQQSANFGAGANTTVSPGPCTNSVTVTGSESGSANNADATGTSMTNTIEKSVQAGETVTVVGSLTSNGATGAWANYGMTLSYTFNPSL